MLRPLPVLLLLTAASLSAQTPVPLYTDLGTHQKSISTTVPEAQQYFNQGLRLVYGFNHAEAIRSFTRATELEPACAMCWWGIAYAYGPHVNAGMDSASGALAYQAVQKALALSREGPAWERAYIEALSTRYAAVPPAVRATLDSAYSQAMRAVAKRYPADLDAVTLAAESMMDLRPWNYWTPEGKPYPGSDEIVSLLEAGRNAEAEAVYREDLRRFPENGGSLFGLSAALKAQGKSAEAAAVEKRFEKAWEGSDVKLIASRF